jgi:dynactin-5
MMFVQEMPFEAQSFIQTSTGNIISRKASIVRPQALEIPTGKCHIAEGVHIRADLASVQLQKYAYIDQASILRPGYILSSTAKFIPMTIGAYSYIGKETIVEAASVGMGCYIGKRCILSARCILKDYVKVLDDTIVPPDMVLPPFSIIGGCPARIIGFQPEAIAALAQDASIDRYSALKPV